MVDVVFSGRDFRVNESPCVTPLLVSSKAVWDLRAHFVRRPVITSLT
jgi:hypothetical protein